MFLYTQSKDYFAQFYTSKDLRSETCKGIPPGWQIQLHFNLALLALSFYMILKVPWDLQRKTPMILGVQPELLAMELTFLK